MPTPLKCPLCKASHKKQSVITSHVYGGKPGQAFFRCGNCDVSYLFPGLSPEEELQFYAAEFSNFMSDRAGTSAGWEEPKKHVESNAWMVKRRMKYLESRLPKTGRILEIGCSSAFMLYPLKERGFECIGVEPSGAFFDYVNSRGIKCFKTIDDLIDTEHKKDGFDLIFHGFVLEHISKPHLFLQQQLDLLRPGGKLIFEIPNSADALLTIYDIPEFERFYWIVAHTWVFSKESLKYLLEMFKLPFEIILDQRYDLSNHLVWARDRKPGGMNNFTSKFGNEIEEHYRDALISSGNCDTLIGIVTKE